MLDVFIAKHHQATIVRTQTTYMDVAVASGTVRLHYRDKREFSLKIGVRGVLSQALEHPLLWDYNGPCTTVYLSGPAPDPPALLKALQEVVASVSQHWRALDHYLRLTQLELNLTEGSGLLLEGAPAPIVQAVIGLCQQHDTPTYTFPVLLPDPPPMATPFIVLFIGACYIIAHDFTVQEL